MSDAPAAAKPAEPTLRERIPRPSPRGALLVAGCVLAFVALLATWVRTQALDSDHWTDTSAAIIASPDVQRPIAAYLADQVTQSPALADGLRSALPTQLGALAGPLTGALGDVAEEAALRGLSSGGFQQLWQTANRKTHEQFVAAVDGRTILGRGIVLDLRPIVGKLATRLGGTPAGLPPGAGRVVVIPPDTLDEIRWYVDALNAVAWWTTALALLCLVGSVAVAPDRRAAAASLGGGLVLVGLLVLVMRRVGGRTLVDAVSANGHSGPAARATWEIVTALLRHLAWTVAILGACVWGGAWLGSAAARAQRLRAFAAPVLARRGLAVGLAVGAVLVLVTFGLLPWSTSPVALLAYLAGAWWLVEGARSASPALGDVPSPPAVAH